MGAELTPEGSSSTLPAADCRARAIVEHLPGPVLVLDRTGLILWSNPAAHRLGMEETNTSGRTVFSAVAAADLERFREAFGAAVEQCGTAVAVASVCRRLPSGGSVSLDDTLTYLPDIPGIAGVLLVSRESTANGPSKYDNGSVHARGDKLAPFPAPQQNEERLQLVARLSATGIFDHDHASGDMYWSPEQREIYGVTADERIEFSLGGSNPMDTWSLIYPPDRETVASAVAQAHKDPTGVFDVEHRIVRRDGTVRWIASRSQTFFAGQGAARHAVRTIGAVQDITDRKRLDRQLRLTQASVDRSNTAIYWIRIDGRITYANDHACQNLGRTREEMLELNVWDLDATLSKESWDALYARLDAKHSMVTRTHHLRKDGTRFPVEITRNLVIFDGEPHVFVFAQDRTNTEHAERNLELLSAAVNGSRTPFFTSDQNGRIIYANQHAHESLGYTRDELLGCHIWDIDPGVTPARYQELWELLKRERFLMMPTTHSRKDGSLIPLEVTTSYFSFRGDEYSLTFAQDVTERQMTSLALRQSQERLQQALAVYNIGIFEDDQVSGTSYWSPEFRDAWKVPADQNPDADYFTRSIHPEDVRGFLAAVGRARDPSGDGRLDVQMRVMRNDGTPRWMDVRSQTFFEGSGADRHPARTVGAVVDITGRREIDEALRVSERSLREAQSIAQLGNWAIDSATNRITWSEEVYRLFEVPSDFNVSYAAFLTRVHPDDRARVDAAWQKSLTDFTPYKTTHRILIDGGQPKYLEERAEIDLGPDGRPLMWRGISQDVTARVEAEAAIRASLQEKETLLREIHHRVKNNLQIIASLLHFQSKRVRDVADVEAFTDGRNRLRAMILVHEKLYQSHDLSNIEIGSYLRSLVTDLHLSYSAEGHRPQIKVSADRVALPVEIAAPCGMIVCELLTNAFKYAFPGRGDGDIQVSLTSHDGELRLSVQDNGVGLPSTFDPQTAGSFGWQLIRNLAAQINGTIAIDRINGTRVMIDFEHEDEAK